MARGGVRVNRTLTIPSNEIRYSFGPSGGPGGQHANKTSTRVELNWNVEGSKALGPRQRDRILNRLARRIDSSGDLRLTSDRYRSQYRNREDVTERFASIIAGALKAEKSRIPTGPSKAAKERRLQAKRRRSNLKRDRRGHRDLEGDG